MKLYAILFGASAAFALLLSSVSSVNAAEQVMDGYAVPAQVQQQDQDRIQDRDRLLTDRPDGVIYGSKLMTEQERYEYRQRMMQAKGEQEREEIRWEHHKAMQERAQKMGLKLPDEPPQYGTGKGMGQGKGQNQGLGLGPGKGSGKRMGQGGGKR